MSGVLNIIFRITVKFIEEFFFKGGKEVLHINEGGWYLLLLPLIPVAGMILLIPLSLLFPGEVNGYGFTKFLRKVNLEGGYIRSRTIFLKIISTALTIGTGNSAGVEGTNRSDRWCNGIPGWSVFPCLWRQDETLYSSRLCRRNCGECLMPR